VHSTEIKLVDVPEMNYTSSKYPPSGEVWIRGPTVTQGYYQQADKTDEAYKMENDSPYSWFATGDIGMWLDNGSLKLIDRKKNLIKPPHGEYIALEKLESAYRNCNLVDFVLVYADQYKNECVAVAVPNRDRLTEWAKNNNIKNDSDLTQICEDPIVKAHVLSELKTTGRKMKLRSIETVRNVYLCPWEWNPQNNMLTAAMKLNRNEIIKKFRGEIDQLYEEL